MEDVNDHYHEWTSCEVHGHNFVANDEDNPEHRVCSDCGETAE